MQSIISNSGVSDFGRREKIFEGAYFIFASKSCTRNLVEHASNMIRESLGHDDPEGSQEHLPVEEFVKIVGSLKSNFTNSLVTKQLIQEIFIEFGCDLGTTYFDVPRLRIVPYGGYLSSGVSYAYKPHRDTWYSSPHEQINWWLPVYDIDEKRSMTMLPSYWDKAVPNSSKYFDYGEWCKVGRPQATKHVKEDSRKHPLPTAAVNKNGEIRICGAQGDLLMFSAAHLHSTAENTSNRMRFSIDFRTINSEDFYLGRAAPNVDSLASGTTLGDFISATNFSPLDEKIIDSYRSRKINGNEKIE